MLSSHRRAIGGLFVAGALATGVAACGSGGSSSGGSGSGGSGASAASSNPQALLKQTFASTHSVKSGVLDLSLVVTPKGSSVLTTPLSFSLSGPFQSRASGQIPESSFTLSFTGLGKHGSFGVTTTGSGAYVNIEGANYQLPSADFKQLQSKLTGSAGGSAPGLSTLGINPDSWVKSPQIIGTATVDGVTTEHLRAAVDLPAVISSINTLLAKDGSTLKAEAGVTPHISASTASKLAAAIHNPTLDVYTGKSDSTLRRLVLAATVSVGGTTSTQLGGLSSAGVRLTLDYQGLNQPQSIAAPSNVHSYAQLQTKLQGLGSQLEESLGAGGLGSTSGSTGSGSTGSAGQVSKYSNCINGAGGNVKKMQRCAKYLQSGG